MTGTALTEAGEFDAIYKLAVVSVPTNKPVVRADLADFIFGSEPEKFTALITEIEELHARRPAGAGRHHLGRRQRTPERGLQAQRHPA